MKPELSIIVAVAQNLAIGKDNKLLWHLSEDLKRFKRITGGHAVVMGKKTFESLPVRPLPGRKNIVITDIPGEQIEGCVMAYSIEEAVNLCDAGSENFIIGGASIYRQFFTMASKLYITWVHREFDADTFFPSVDESEWENVEQSEKFLDEKSGLNYTFVIYKRR